MLNINQNFDLKAPVFNFDRDYFNSVEELNAYDTSNIPNHFVTNVAGMLYLFTDGKWLPMISTETSDDTHHYVNLGCAGAYLEIDTQNDVPSSLSLYGTSSNSVLSPTALYINSNDPVGGVSIEADYDGNSAGITVSSDGSANTIVTDSLIICGDDSFKVDIYGDEGRMEINDAQGRCTNYSASGFSGQNKDNTISYSLSLPSKNTDNVSLSLESDLGNSTFIAGEGFSIDNTNGYSIFTDMGDGSINLSSTSNSVTVSPTGITATNDSTAGSINILTNKKLTEEEQGDGYSPVDISLTDGHNSANINTGRGFMHKTENGLTSSLDYYGLYVDDGTYLNQINSNLIVMSNGDVNGSIEIYTDNEQPNGSPINMSLTDNDYKAYIDAISGFTHKTDDNFKSELNGYGLITSFNGGLKSYLSEQSLLFSRVNGGERLIYIGKDYGEDYYIEIGSDEKFKISRPADNTEGATITGIKSLTAFANPSATKVFATDGSIADLSTKANVTDLDAKANASDVLLKKSASGGYYIEENSNELGLGAFAASSMCIASGMFAYAEGAATASGMIAHAEMQATASGDMSHAENAATANGKNSHAEGIATASGEMSHAENAATASGEMSHAEGTSNAGGQFAHAEGRKTVASGYASHALGCNNVDNINAIHSVGIGRNPTKKNAEYIYAKNKENGTDLADDPKNGYKYLIGVGGYDGISTDNTTYKSVQEVIADLTARIEQLETLVANCVSISNVDEQTN